MVLKMPSFFAGGAGCSYTPGRLQSLTGRIAAPGFAKRTRCVHIVPCRLRQHLFRTARAVDYPFGYSGEDQSHVIRAKALFVPCVGRQVIICSTEATSDSPVAAGN